MCSFNALWSVLLQLTCCFVLNRFFVSADNNYAFYIHGAEEQMCSGYLYKSPPENQFKSQVCFSGREEQVTISAHWWESLWSFFSFCICFPNLFLQKSWKRRFFVLLKYRDNKCQLKYYKNEEKNKPLGDIDLSTYVQYLHSALFISNWTSCIISLKPVCQLPINLPQ